MTNETGLHPSRGLAITYLVRLGIGSPSGGRSEIENLNVIKKIREGFIDFPYASSQAMKRALKDTLKGLGFDISPIITSSPARTAGVPVKYIDDDLFGFMDPSSKKESSDEDHDSATEDESEQTEGGGVGDFVFSKDMIEKIKTKKLKERINSLFENDPNLSKLSEKELQEAQFTESEIKSIKKALKKDDLAKMLKNLRGVRKSVVSMTPLLSMSEFQDNVDFGANMLGLKGGVSPMPYETEVHRGWYRITLYIDLDRIGTGDGFLKALRPVGEEKGSVTELLSQNIKFDFIHKISGKKLVLIEKEYAPLDDETKYTRAKALIDAIRFLAPSGRSSNWLIDLTPKLMVAAYVKGARTPFLESPLLDEKEKDKNVINLPSIKTAKDMFDDGIDKMVIGYREDLLEMPADKMEEQNEKLAGHTMKAAFDIIDGWLKTHFKISEQNPAPQPEQPNTQQG